MYNGVKVLSLFTDLYVIVKMQEDPENVFRVDPFDLDAVDFEDLFFGLVELFDEGPGPIPILLNHQNQILVIWRTRNRKWMPLKPTHLGTIQENILPRLITEILRSQNIHHHKILLLCNRNISNLKPFEKSVVGQSPVVKSHHEKSSGNCKEAEGKPPVEPGITPVNDDEDEEEWGSYEVDQGEYLETAFSDSF